MWNVPHSNDYRKIRKNFCEKFTTLCSWMGLFLQAYQHDACTLGGSFAPFLMIRSGAPALLGSNCVRPHFVRSTPIVESRNLSEHRWQSCIRNFYTPVAWTAKYLLNSFEFEYHLLCVNAAIELAFLIHLLKTFSMKC